MLNVFQEKVKSFCVKNFAVSGKKSNFAEEKLCSTIKNVLFMKKIFTLIATAVFALTANAEVLINYSTSQDGITNGGTTTFDAVKINVNTVSTPCIKFANSYSTEGKVNDNKVALNVEGGFKAGDMITLAGYFNNADDTKQAAVEIFTINSDDTPNVLFTSQPFINGRTSSATATEESYILEADADVLYVGRKGNTAACITLLKVTQATAVENVAEAKVAKTAPAKVLKNGQIFIGNYTVAGAQVK